MHIAQGLQQLHNKKILHRDVKPENILVTKNTDSGYIMKLGDFGTSRSINDQEEENIEKTVHVGSYAYMHPKLYIPKY